MEHWIIKGGTEPGNHRCKLERKFPAAKQIGSPVDVADGVDTYSRGQFRLQRRVQARTSLIGGRSVRLAGSSTISSLKPATSETLDLSPLVSKGHDDLVIAGFDLDRSL